MQIRYRGPFALRGYGKARGDGRFEAVFVVTEPTAAGEMDSHHSTHLFFDSETAAIAAADAAAAQWLERLVTAAA